MALAKPTQITVPFSSNGIKNTIPETATGSNLASMQEGFPVITMTDVDQGGMPPQGQDMNGILFDVTTAIRYQQAGGLFPYDATFAQAIDGYPLGALLTSADGSCLYQNTVSGNVSDPDNGGQGWSQILSSASIAGKQDKLTPVQMDAVNSGITSARVSIYDSYANGKQDTLTFDNTPTNGSSNPVTSDGIYTALGTKQDTITFDATPQSGSTNPVQSGGVYDALAEKVNIDNAGNAEVIATGTTEARTLADRFADINYALSANASYKKRVIKELASGFPDYASIIASTGASWLYPQGFCYDDEGNLYLNYCSNLSVDADPYSYVVKYNSNFEYVGYIRPPHQIESIVVLKQEGKTYLYMAGGTDFATEQHNLNRYDISAATFSGEIISNGTAVITDCDSLVGYDSGRWIVRANRTHIGQANHMMRFRVYDSAFNQIGEFILPKIFIGYASTNWDYYYYIPKMQGMAVRGDCLFISTGALNTPENPHRCGDYGVWKLSFQGDLIASSVVDGGEFFNLMKSEGVITSDTSIYFRTENEGVFIMPDGQVQSLCVVGSRILLLEEFAQEGIDCSAIPSKFVPFNVQEYVNRFPLTYDENTQTYKLVNPITQNDILTWEELLGFMTRISLPSTVIANNMVQLTSSIANFTGFPTYSAVKVSNLNNYTFVLESGSIRVILSPSGNTYNASLQSVYASNCILGHKTSLNGVNAPMVGTSGSDAPYLRIFGEGAAAGNGANIYLYGVSHSTNKNMIDFQCNSGTNVRIRFNGTSKSFYPTSDADINLGLAANRWKDVYSSNSVIQTSDERLKSTISDISDDVLDAWGDVNLIVFQFKDAIEKKGEDARIHTGVIAQQVQQAFEARGLDAFRYGLLCYDKWEDEFEDVEIVDKEAVFDKEGNEIEPAVIHTEQRQVQEAGDRYSIRYEEALILEAAYQRRRADRIESRLKAIEERMR